MSFLLGIKSLSKADNQELEFSISSSLEIHGAFLEKLNIRNTVCQANFKMTPWGLLYKFA